MFKIYKYNIVIFITVVLTFIQACVNMIISYKFLLDSAHGFQYGAIIACQIIASSLFAPKLAHLLDRLERPAKIIFLFYLIISILHIYVLKFNSFPNFLFFVFVLTVVTLLQSAIVYKLLPMLFSKAEVKSFNVWAEQATSMAFLGSAILVPFTFYVVNSYKEFFIFASGANLIAGLVLYQVFSEISIPIEDAREARNSKIVSAYLLIFSDRRVRHFFFTSNFYLFAFSATAFSLAMIAKGVVGKNIYLYSYPIFAMFIGRLISLSILKRYLDVNVQNLFFIGCLISAVFMWPLGLINNIYILSVLEFFLGVGIALAKYSERSFYQLQMNTVDLSKIAIVRGVSTLLNKSISIPFVLILIYYGNSELVSGCLSFFYLLAGLIMLWSFGRQRQLAEFPST